MLIAWLQTHLTTPSPHGKRGEYFFWLGLSLFVSLGYALLALQQALSSRYVVQDDARQYLFWMQQLSDPTLFANDLMADYFRSVTPLGFKGLYRGAIALGIQPFTLNIGLPTVLGLLATQYLFRLTFAILPIPFTAWIAAVVFNQTVWMKDDLVSATPRAFVYPLFLAFLFYWVQFETNLVHPLPQHGRFRSPFGLLLKCTIALALLGLFYPQYVLLAGLLLAIAVVQDGPLRAACLAVCLKDVGGLSRRLHILSPLTKGGVRQLRAKGQFYVITLSTIALVVLFYATTASDYGPVVTLAQAKTMPEFWPGGRNFFFSDNLWWFFGVGDRSGLLHVGWVRPATLSLGIFLPIMLRFPQRFPLINAITPHVYRLSQFLGASVILFVAAHVFLFRLHLPSRYTDHSLRMIMAIATALTLTLTLDTLFNRCRAHPPPTSTPPLPHSPTPPLPHSPLRHRILAAMPQKLVSATVPAIAFLLLLLTLLLAYPQFVDPFPLTKYKTGHFPNIYAYLRRQPVDTLVASIAKEADNIPIFAQRSILIGHEYAIPYHTGYYEPFRRRAIALLKAQYTPDRAELTRFIQTYGVDVWMVEKAAYQPDYLTDHWIRQYATRAGLSLNEASHKRRPALQRRQNQCLILKESHLHLIDAHCLIEP